MPPLERPSVLRGDLFGGLTAGIVALPLALALGAQTELGPIAGLYGAIALGIVAALFGGTKTQISGPTAPMTVVSAVVIADAVQSAGSLEQAIPLIVATFLLAGFIEAAMGFFGLGKYIRYIPYPVVSGFMSGIGVIIIITQLFPMLGVDAPAGGPLATIRALNTVPDIVNFTSVLLAVLTIGIIYSFPRLNKTVPSTLVALVVISLSVYLWVDADAVTRINSKHPIPSGLPELELGFVKVFGDFNLMVQVFEYAFTLAALGALDSLLTSVVADNMTKTRHNSDRELIGQGLGNMVSALIAGLPGAGATMRTVINIRSGGRTKISGLVAGVFLLAVLLGLGPLVGHIPNAVLAGILITVGIGIIDYRGWRHLRSVPRADAVVLVVVFLLTVFVNLLVAVGAGMVMSAMLFMKTISDVVEERTQLAPLRDFAQEQPWSDDQQLMDRLGNQVVIKHLYGPLFFGFAARFQQMLSSLSELRVVVLRMERVPYIDQSGLYALDEAIQRLSDKGILVVFSAIGGQPLAMCERVKLIPNRVEERFCFASFGDCAAWIEDYLGGSESGGEESAAGATANDVDPAE